MRIFQFILFAAVTFGLVAVLSTKQGSIPALGPLLSPASGCWQQAERGSPPAQGEVAFTQLEAPVEVVYDERRVPHIFSGDLNDLAFVQGYVTAGERLWQMEFQVLAAAGRLSEIFGPDFAEAGDGLVLRRDRLQRRLGLTYGAEQAMEALAADPEMTAILQAYAQGVNAWIEQLSPREYPLEYKLLGYSPEAWAPIKTALLVKSMTQTLTGYENDVAFSNMLAQLGRPLFERMFPDGGGNLSPIVDKVWEFEPVPIDTPQAPVDVLTSRVIGGRLPAPASERRNLGSNNWAVSGAHTSSGRPMLANDPHLMLNLPSLWYEVQLSGPGLNAYGVSLPGAPGIVLGFNADIAWGVTNAGRDVKDWYRIRFKDRHRNVYYHEGEWREVSRRVERFTLPDGTLVTDTILFTHHGPVVYDGDLSTEGYTDLALHWELHRPSLEIRAFFDLDRASDYDDYREAISHFGCPGQNFVFASRQGDIAITQQGHFPALWPGQGRFVMDGSRAVNDWQAYIPFEQNPTQRNPSRGFVSSANQFGADSLYPYYQHGGEFEKYRNRRINERLSEEVEGGTVDDRTLKELQLDNFNYLASEAMPSMMKALGERSGQEITALEDWNGFNDAASQGAAVFHYWFAALEDLIWDEVEALEGPVTRPEPFFTIELMREAPDHVLFDRAETPEPENLATLCDMAWDSMLAHMAGRDAAGLGRDWASVKGTDMLHLISSLEAFSVMDVVSGGDKHIVNATSTRWGPSWRMVADMTDPPRAWGVYPGGQSGNPGSTAYDAFIPDWAGGRYYPLNRYPDLTQALEAGALARLSAAPVQSSPAP